MSELAPDDHKSSARKGIVLPSLVVLLALCIGGGWWWSHRAASAADGASPAPATPSGGRSDSTGKDDPGAAGRKGGARGGTPSVVLARVRNGDLDVWSDSLGTVTPLANVTIHSRVDGQLLRVLYKEGQRVHSGDLLAEIDPRPFQVTLDQALAQLARDRALLDNARTDLERYRDLAAHDAVPRQTLDTQTSLVAQYEATLRNDQAAIDSARLQLSFCRIEAPVDGQVGLRQIDPGNMVHAADATGLVTVAQMDPISVLFSLPQDQLPQIQKRLRSRLPVRLEAYDRSGATLLGKGSLASLDNQIDTTTGAIKLRGSFANRDGTLYPNQFVNLRVLLDTRQQVAIIPTAAIQRGADGPYVYVLNADQTVSVRKVVPGPADRSELAVESGLHEGEQVVIDGTDKLREGLPVKIADARGGATAGPAGAAHGAHHKAQDAH